MTVSQTKWRLSLAFTFLHSLNDTSEGCLNDNTVFKRKRPFDQSGGDGGAGECVVAKKKAANQIGALTK